MSEAHAIPETSKGRDYHDADGLSQSGLKRAASDPKLFFEEYVEKTRPRKPPTPSQQFGLDLEQLVLYGENPDRYIPIPPNVLNVDGHRKGAAWTTWESQQLALRPDLDPKKDLIKQYELQAILTPLHEARAEIFNHPKARWLIDDANRHVTVRWKDEQTGWWCKAQLDLVKIAAGKHIICDLKTAKDSRPAKFRSAIWDYGYHIQAWWYREAYRQLTGIVAHYCFIVVENKPSYSVETIDLDDKWYALAEQQIQQAKEDLAKCYATGKWLRPTHGKMTTLEPPPWAEQQMPAFSEFDE